MVSLWPIICLVLEPFGLLNCDDPSIIELKANTFDQFLSDNEFVMVKFYTPWCQHCKNFRTEYSKLSRTLQMVESKIKLAKVNVGEQKMLGQENGINSFPTMKLFINGKPLEYPGQHNAASINSWMSRKIDPILVLDTLDDIEMFADDETGISVIGFFTNPNSKQSDAFKNAVLNDESDIQFAMVTSPDLQTEYGVENNQVILYKNFDDRKVTFAADLNADNLKRFFSMMSRPLLYDFKMETASKIIKRNAEDHLFVFVTKSDKIYSDMENGLRDLAKKWRESFVFVIVDMDIKKNYKISNLFDVDLSDVPTYRIVQFDDSLIKYKPVDQQLTIDGVGNFIEKFVSGDLVPQLNTQELPSDWDAQPVKILVSSNFDGIVFDVQKDVLVEFYSPRCGHCKSMEKAYNQLGEHYRDSKTVVIAKMDATLNELAHTKIRGFPTIKMYRRGDNEVTDYEGSRTLESFISFIEEIQNLNKTMVEKDEL